MNFSRNAQCLRCKAEGPSQDARVSKVQEMKTGDWTCPQYVVTSYNLPATKYPIVFLFFLMKTKYRTVYQKKYTAVMKQIYS